MKYITVAALMLLSTSTAFAQATQPNAKSAAPAAPVTCKAQAAGKKLAGAALTAFMKKCEKDATASCASTASKQKLAGAAKASFSKKCVTEAVGN